MKTLRFAVLVWMFVAPAGESCVFAGANDETVKKTISANENYLKRFRKEREVLAQAPGEESAKKMQSLDQKIRNLETENARLLEQIGGRPPAAVAGPVQTPAAPAISKPVETAEVPRVQVPVIAPKIESAPAVVAAPPAQSAPASRPGSAVAEWETMTREKKEQYVQNFINRMKREGKIVQRHPLFYTALMDYVFVSDAQLAAKPLQEAVLATINKNEGSRV